MSPPLEYHLHQQMFLFDFILSLQALAYLNLAINNVTKIENLQKCESLERLDLTINFVPKAGLLTLESLAGNDHLRELTLMGNPCTDWPGYREYVIAKLPQLEKLDGQAIKKSEKIAASQVVEDLERRLKEELILEGIDPEQAAFVEDDSIYDENGQVIETGELDDKGEMRRPWCVATRILEHREQEKMNREADDRKRAASSSNNNNSSDGAASSGKPVRRDGFEELKEGERVMQKNEGGWDFSIQEDDEGKAIVLEVDVGKYLDTSLIKADVQPSFVRLLIKGKLLQLLTPCEVRPGNAVAQRSNATGKLQIVMPKERAGEKVTDVAHIRPSKAATGLTTSSKPDAKAGDGFVIREERKAVVQAVGAEEDDDFIPDL